MEIERANLLAFARMVIRDVLQNTSENPHVIMYEDDPSAKPAVITAVKRLLTIVEHCLCHGLRRSLPVIDDNSYSGDLFTNGGFLRHSNAIFKLAKDRCLSDTSIHCQSCLQPDPWPVLLHLEQLLASCNRLSETVNTMSELRTGLGKSRAWILQALMQKSLSAYFQHLVDGECPQVPPGLSVPQPSSTNGVDSPEGELKFVAPKRLPREFFYHPGALLLNDEGVVFAGLLVGLSSIDFCFALKDNLGELDYPLHVIPYHIFMQYNVEQLDRLFSKQNSYAHVNLTSVIDQKSLLEDMNTKLRKRLDCAQVRQVADEERTAALTTQVDALKLENRSLRIAIDHFRNRTPETGTNTSELPPQNGVTLSDALQPHPGPEFDDELNRLRNENEEKSILVRSLRAQLSENQSHAIQLKRELTNSRTLLEQKQLLIRQLEGKTRGLTTIVEQMRERLASVDAEKASLDRVLEQLRLQVSDLQTRCSLQQDDSKIQQELLCSLQSQLKERTTEVEQLQATVTELNTCKERVSQLQEEVEHWRTLCKEQESSLSEMATVVSSSKLEADNLRESHNALQDAQWTADSLVPNCSKCHVAFSVSRRRHHCRNCGLIFCHFCSTQTMSLPSAAKPVRVCDRCHNLLLHRYTAKS
ncbi:hypothetical protein P879_07689 [Paragonimus westermani]|uniref:RUN and FYVE domain-containing protein 1 n=1 Tax=Paragonimus westermani TaxID=34504 RepID=A0A8T0DDB5_9TREM|nr:hypothetical protein P879_07689 [Paragonimus westermani]